MEILIPFVFYLSSRLDDQELETSQHSGTSRNVNITRSQHQASRSRNRIQEPQTMDTVEDFRYEMNIPINTTVCKHGFDVKDDYIPLDTTKTIQSQKASATSTSRRQRGKKRAALSQEVEPARSDTSHTLQPESILSVRSMLEDPSRSSEWVDEKNPFLRLQKKVKYDKSRKHLDDDEKIRSLLSTSRTQTQTQNTNRGHGVAQNILDPANEYGSAEKRLRISKGSSSTTKACRTAGISSSNEEAPGWIQSMISWFKK